MKAEKVSIITLACLLSIFVTTAHSASLENRVPAPVIVVNAESNPIPVAGGITYPIQKSAHSTFVQSYMPEYTNVTIYEVPNNQRLVIEYFSCISHSGAFSTSYTCCINTDNSDASVTHCLPSTPYGYPYTPIAVIPGTTNPVQLPPHMSAGQMVKLFAEPGTQVLAIAYRAINKLMPFDELPEDTMEFAFSGYLEDIAE